MMMNDNNNFFMLKEAYNFETKLAGPLSLPFLPVRKGGSKKFRCISTFS